MVLTSSPHVQRLDTRKEQILALVVREYIRSATPIGSRHLEECGDFGASTATIRNEMAALTELGFLSQPHTSAGRIPTEVGYRYYIEHSLTSAKPNVNVFRAAWEEEHNHEQKLRHLARLLARESGGGVFMSMDDDEVYLTGLSFLFGQPEFHSMDFLHDVTIALDALEEHLHELTRHSDNSVRIMLGNENPVHAECATMLLRSSERAGVPVVFGVVGPLRMDYDRVLPLLLGIEQLIQE